MNKEIEKFLKDRFVSDVGFADCSDSPYEGLNNAISLVFKLSDAIVEQIDNKPTHTYLYNGYLKVCTYNQFFGIRYKICDFCKMVMSDTSNHCYHGEYHDNTSLCGGTNSRFCSEN